MLMEYISVSKIVAEDSWRSMVFAKHVGLLLSGQGWVTIERPRYLANDLCLGFVNQYVFNLKIRFISCFREDLIVI